MHEVKSEPEDIRSRTFSNVKLKTVEFLASSMKLCSVVDDVVVQELTVVVVLVVEGVGQTTGASGTPAL